MPALRLWSIRRSIALVIAAAVLVVGAMVAGAFWYAGWPGVRRDSTVTAGTLFDLLKLVFSVVAGVGGVAALVVAYRRQRVAEHANKLAEFAHELAHAADLRAEAAESRAKIETDRNGIRLFNERFAKASEQLGSDKAAVRLAGVYAMAGLADDWRDGRQTCIDVLCAYLRMPYTPPPTASDGAPTLIDEKAATEARTAREEREVRHTVIRLIVRHLRVAEEEATSWRDLDFDFTGAVFDGGDFSNVTFSGGTVSFAGVTFGGERVSFARVAFSGGAVSFDGATFSSGAVLFNSATFSGGDVSFAGATFSGAALSFARATFSGALVHFDGAKFSGEEMDFLRAKFSDGAVSFDGATFSRGLVSFAHAMFSGAEVFFDGAKFSGGVVLFNSATFSGGGVSFTAATFGSGKVSFARAAFSGGAVSFDEASFDISPGFDHWLDGRPPDGLRPPET
ncbi:pentapeptide repeat-containing protein [Micromonospora sp. NPDC047738]|uniref:pentapeptide repeat-containing protein n=1 Tax=Micromonospora sp. NPDC047738 TaxID=3155741 RepID=UPI0033DCB8D2